MLDPASPLTAPELSFVERAARRVSTVLFVLTKTDVYPGWRELLDDDRALIVRHAPRFADAPWFAVSAALAADAADARAGGDARRADELVAQAGIADLAGRLRDGLAGSAERVRAANRLQATASVVTELATSERQRLRAAVGDPRLLDELDQQEAELAALNDDDAAWVTDLQRGFAEIGTSLQRDFQRRMRDARRELEDRVQRWGTPSTASFVDDVDSVLRAQWVELDSERNRFVVTIAAQLARRLSDDGFDDLAAELPYPERLATLPPLQNRQPDERTMAEYLPVVGSGMVARTVGVQLAPAMFAGPFGILVAAGVGLVLSTKHKERQQLAEAKIDAVRYLARAMEEATAEMSMALRESIAADQQRVHDHVRALMGNRRDELQRQVADARASLDADETRRSETRADAEEHIGRLKELANRGLELSQRLDALAAESVRSGSAGVSMEVG